MHDWRTAWDGGLRALGGLLASLDFNEHVHQRHRGRRDARDPLAWARCGADASQLFLHFAGEAADGGVSRTKWAIVALLGFFQALDGFVR